MFRTPHDAGAVAPDKSGRGRGARFGGGDVFLEPLARTKIAFCFRQVLDDALAVPIGAEARMIVQHSNFLEALRQAVEDRLQGPPRPAGLPSAKEEAAGMRVLSTRDRLLKDRRAQRATLCLQGCRARRSGVRIPAFQAEQRMQPSVVGVDRQRLGEVEKISVQVDVLLGLPALVGEAIGVDRVNKKGCRILRQLAPKSLLQPGRLKARSTEAFGPMRTGEGHQQMPGLPGADPDAVGRQLLASRSFGGAVVAAVVRRRLASSLPEALSGRKVVTREGSGCLRHDLFSRIQAFLAASCLAVFVGPVTLALLGPRFASIQQRQATSE